ncbi:hypothetical protein SVIO_091150 [Streptomyces violaceusniger]|uniref:Uncharacterized protein n=1 Tax=Streptomyces violaceusniger TaxID=68280 RepID=A0A4D4LB65_STRVO|nr:hypothetical protein SVIO_091150 [Streptomyces violaceusniger]
MPGTGRHGHPELSTTNSVLSQWDDFQIPPQAHRGRVTLNLYDQLSAYTPKRPGAYLRISSDRFGLEAGVDRKQEDAEDTRRRLPWGPVARNYKKNDASPQEAQGDPGRRLYQLGGHAASHPTWPVPRRAGSRAFAYGWVRKGPDKCTLMPDESRVVVDIFDGCFTRRAWLTRCGSRFRLRDRPSLHQREP